MMVDDDSRRLRAVDRVALAQRITRVRRRMERAHRLGAPRVSVAVEDLDAMFTAIWMGRLLAVEKQQSGALRNNVLVAVRVFLAWLRRPRPVADLRRVTLAASEAVLVETFPTAPPRTSSRIGPLARSQRPS